MAYAALVVPPWEWMTLVVAIASFILLDLFVLNRGHQQPSIKKAAIQTGMWVGIGALVGVLVLLYHGGHAGTEYYTGWLIEYSLSVDNVFVWGLILEFFGIKPEYRHRLLFWGIFGTLVMRLVFIVLGVSLIEKFSWVVILLGLVLMWSAWSLIKGDDDKLDVSKTRSFRIFSKILPIAEGDYGVKFFVRQGSRIMVTMFFLCMVVLTVLDVIFATDSVPAILSVARDSFIIFASNAMAILGLRALYFLYDAVKDKITRLNEGLAIILGGVGMKMVVSSDMSVFGWFRMPGVNVPTWLSLAFIVVVLAGSIAASKLWPEKQPADTPETAS